ncbi:MAG: biotin carboxylase N-terminal domain-containing protein [Hyphomonadaceae bacterium]
MKKLLIANRGEIAIRIARAAAELEIGALSVISEDDVQSLHVRAAPQSIALSGRGPRAYLDGAQLNAAAKSAGADAIHN